MRRSFFLKGAPNNGKRYGELPKAIPCNILNYKLVHSCLRAKLRIVPFFHILASPKAIPEAIPLRYPSGTKMPTWLPSCRIPVVDT